MPADATDMLLGSGDLYIMEFNGTIPENSVIEMDENRIGGIKGGANLSYKPTIYSAVDDMRRMKKSTITAEEVIFKSGFLSFDLGELAKLCLGAVYTKGQTEDVLEGGGGTTIQQYVIRFVHTMDTGMKVRTTVVGIPGNGFELALSPEAETVINAEFIAAPMNNKGRLFKISKEKAGAARLKTEEIKEKGAK